MKIYHANNTRSIRIIWLCDELAIPLEVETIDFSPSYRNTPEWRAKSPTGKVPVLDDGDIRLFESGAMVDYILRRYAAGRLQPAIDNFEEFALYKQWCWFAEATLARPLGDIAQHTVVRPPAERIPAVVEDAKLRAGVFLDTLNASLEGRDYLLAGGFSAADIMLGYSLRLAVVVNIELSRWQALNAYYQRLLTRRGFQKALQS